MEDDHRPSQRASLIDAGVVPYSSVYEWTAFTAQYIICTVQKSAITVLGT